MSAHHIDEGGIALGGPDRGHVADEPEDETRDPQPQSKSKGSRQCAVDNRDRPRRTAVCTENPKSDHSGGEVRPRWRVN